MTPALRALLRFWWLPAIGAAVGLLAGVVLYGGQPAAVYAASANVLVNSPSAPYLRTQQPMATTSHAPVSTTTTAAKDTKKKKKAKAKPAAPSSTMTPPDTQVLVNAANLYPLLIQSDEIAKLRRSLYGPTPGTVTATALASSTNTYGVYHPSPLPVITVKARSQKRAQAKRLVVDTISAFSVWMRDRQKAAGVGASQRITIEQLQVRVRVTGGPSKGLPLFAAVFVLLAFCGAAVLVDRIRPRRAAAVDDSTLARRRRRVA